MAFFKDFRIILPIFGSMTLLIVLSRCSPIAPSVPKTNLLSSPSQNIPSTVLNSTEASKAALQFAVIRKKASFETDFLDSHRKKKTARIQKKIAKLEKMKVDDLKEDLAKDDGVTIELGSGSESLEVTLVINNVTKSDLKEFALDLESSDQVRSRWTLSVANSVSKEVAERVLQNLESVSFSYEADANE